MSQVVNARIKETKLGFEDHGIFTFNFYLSFSQCSNGYFGNYALDNYNGKYRAGTEKGCQIIMDLLKTIGVYTWEDIKGQLVRVEFNEMRRPIRLGNILEDNWICIEDYFKEELAEESKEKEDESNS